MIPITYPSNRNIITRVTVGIALLFVLWRMTAGLSLSQLQQPVLFKMDADFSYWMIKILGVSELLVHSTMAGIVFTIIFIGSGLVLLWLPRKTAFAWLFAICYFIYSVIINIYACHSMHYMAVFSIILFAFCARKEEYFVLSWRLMRYYVCFIYSNVFLMKLVNGAFLDWDSGYVFFQDNITEYLFHNESTIMSSLYRWFLQHPFIVNLSAKTIFLFEGIFFIGFFTKKYDKLLIIAAIIIFLSTYIFIDVFFIELLLAVCCPLISEQSWNKLSWLNK